MRKDWAPELLSVLRIMLAYLFIQVGTAKVFAVPAAVMPGGGTAAVGSLAWVAGMIEIIGGPFILLGLFTRPVAFVAIVGQASFQTAGRSAPSTIARSYREAVSVTQWAGTAEARRRASSASRLQGPGPAAER